MITLTKSASKNDNGIVLIKKKSPDQVSLMVCYLPEHVFNSKEMNATLWEVSDGTVLQQIEPYSAHEYPVLFVQVSTIAGEGSWWLEASEDGQSIVDFWNKQGGYVYPDISICGEALLGMDGSKLVAPSALLWWLPEQDLSPYQAQRVEGAVKGNYPTIPPQNIRYT